MARTQLPYKEGDWFAVPLRDGGYALGRVARADGRGQVLGYFFGPRRRALPTAEDTRGLSAADAVLVGLFGDLGLLEGAWPILPGREDWNRDDWPMPAFRHMIAGAASQREYDESTFELVRLVRARPDDVCHLPEDRFYGYVAVEITLNRRLRLRRD